MNHQELTDQIYELLPAEDYGSVCITIEAWRRAYSGHNERKYGVWVGSNRKIDASATSAEGLIAAVRECIEKAKQARPTSMSNAEYNNLYVRSNRGQKAEEEIASEESLRGTNRELRQKNGEAQ